jgi:hypothetical protein
MTVLSVSRRTFRVSWTCGERSSNSLMCVRMPRAASGSGHLGRSAEAAALRIERPLGVARRPDLINEIIKSKRLRNQCGSGQFCFAV